MRVKPARYVYDVEFLYPHDWQFAITVLRAAAREWASCSNESEPLLDLADQIERQGSPAPSAVSP